MVASDCHHHCRRAGLAHDRTGIEKSWNGEFAMKLFRSISLVVALLFPAFAIAQTSGGLTRSGAVNPGDLSRFKNNSQLEKVPGTPLNLQCLVYTGTYPSGSWGAGSCAGGASGVQQIIAGTGITITEGTPCILNCTINVNPAATVTSFNGRFGVVVPATNDYNFTNLAGSIASGQIPVSVVALSKLANGTALSVIGRSANSVGVYADINCTAASDAVLRESGSTIGCGTVATNGIANDAVTTAKILNNNVTTAKIADANVTYAKIQNATGNSLVGNPGAAGAVVTNIVLPACSAANRFLQWIANTGFQCFTSLVVESRAVAATLDFTAVGTVRTLGYDAPGDGGGAIFDKVGAVPFRDQYILTGTITAGSGYTNGTYNGVRMTGGTGAGCMAQVTIAGGVMTVVNLLGNYCAAYAVGDALTPVQADVGGTGTGAIFTVATISTPLGSFTDVAANKMQYVTDANAFPNVKQFGAKLDWNGSDGTATNDILSFRSAFAFAVVPYTTANAYVAGTRVIVPKGAALLCAGSSPFTALVVPQGVALVGGSAQYAATLQSCAAEGGGTHFLTLCDPNSQVGQFGCKLENIAVKCPQSGASANVSCIYSNSGQQFPLVDNVYIESVSRQCIRYEIGRGGAANAIFQNFDCERTDSTSNVGFFGNSSGTQIKIENAVFGCAPSNCANGVYAINAVAGNFIVDTVHIEQNVSPINHGTTSASALSAYRNLTLTSGCTSGITLSASNPNNTVSTANIESSCTTTVVNGHSGGSSVTGHIMAERVYNP
jgi:hypothetical protein